MAFAKTLLTIVSRLIGGLFLFSGVWGVIDPLPAGRDMFAIRTATSETVTFYPGLAGRNFAAGLAIWIFSLAGQRKAVGVVLTCAICNGLSDIYLILIHPHGGENVGIHVFNICLLAVVGPLMMFL